MNRSDSRFDHFAGLVDKHFSRDRIESFWELEGPFRDLARSAFSAEMINTQLRELIDNKSHMGDWRPNQLMLHRGKGLTLSIWLFEQSRQYVHTLPALGMYSPMGNVPLQYSVYQLPPQYRNDIFDPRIQIRKSGSGSVEPNEVLKLDPHLSVYDFHIEEPIPVLKLVTSTIWPMEWLFIKGTGYAWQANDSELVATQLRVAAYVLGRLADPSSVQPLEKLAEHPHHAVRWAAIQGLGRISRSAALSKLHHAVSDPHPHIQRAAVKTLAQLKSGV